MHDVRATSYRYCNYARCSQLVFISMQGGEDGCDTDGEVSCHVVCYVS